jgi:site-specific recombinase XerD
VLQTDGHATLVCRTLLGRSEPWHPRGDGYRARNGETRCSASPWRAPRSGSSATTARNHSRKLLEHCATTFRAFARFLEASDRTDELAALTTPTFEAFVAYLKATPLSKPYRGTTERSIVGIHGHRRDLRACVRWCQDEEPIDRRVKIPLPKLPRRLFPILSDEGLLTLFRSRLMSGKSDAAVRNRALLAILLDTRIRLGELAGLTTRSIPGPYLRVIGKGDEERIVPFQPDAGTLLAAWLKLRASLEMPEEEPLFLRTYSGTVSLVRRLKKETGVDVFPHKLRHTAATKLVIAKVDLAFVKELLGLSSITTTEGYLSLAKEHLRDKHAEGSPFASIASMLPDQRPKKPTRRRLRMVS